MASKQVKELIKKLADALEPFSRIPSRPRAKVDTMLLSKAIQEAKAAYDEVKDLPILK